MIYILLFFLRNCQFTTTEEEKESKQKTVAEGHHVELADNNGSFLMSNEPEKSNSSIFNQNPILKKFWMDHHYPRILKPQEGVI